MIGAEKHALASCTPIWNGTDMRTLFVSISACDDIAHETKFFRSVCYCVKVKLSKVVTCIVFKS